MKVWVPNALSLVQAVAGPLVVSAALSPALTAVVRIRHLPSPQSHLGGHLHVFFHWRRHCTGSDGHLPCHRSPGHDRSRLWCRSFGVCDPIRGVVPPMRRG